MSVKKLPGIWFGSTIRSILTLDGSHDHSPSKYHEGPTVVACEDTRCRQELFRKGGVELRTQTWFIARDRKSISIGQDDGTDHLHEPAGKDYTVTCDSPTCNAFFMNDRDVASLKAETRPHTVTEIETAQNELEEMARREAAIEVEVGRQRRSALFSVRR